VLFRSYEKLKIEDPIQYENVVLGGWISEPEGVLFKKSELKSFTELPKDEPVAKLAFIDPADTGKDAHSMPVAYLYSNGNYYIEEVLYTTLGVDVNVMMSAEMINRHKPEFVRIEINMGGGMYPYLLTPLLTGETTLLTVRERTAKHARIFTSSGLIKKYCHFKEDYKHGSDYYKFMHNLTQYMADGSSEHDDAPDSLAGLTNMIKQFYSDLYES
jgi:hypothetical protein